MKSIIAIPIISFGRFILSEMEPKVKFIHFHVLTLLSVKNLIFLIKKDSNPDRDFSQNMLLNIMFYESMGRFQL